MRDYNEAERRYYASLDQAAERYARGLEQADLQPNETLTRAMGERAHKNALADYRADLDDVHTSRVDTIMGDHRRRMNEIKREGARLRWSTCPVIVALLALCAWYNFAHQSVPMGIVYTIGALAFLAMLVGGQIFDRPQ